jgi:hypothetical protein
MRERPRSNEANGMPKAVSLFSGAGGLDLGLEAAGWQVLAQIEMDETCVETLRLQAEGKEAPPEVVPDRIENIRPQKLLRARNLLTVAFARNGTVIPYGEFLIEPDSHRLGIFLGVALLQRIVAGENRDGRFQALFCACPCHGLAGHLS